MLRAKQLAGSMAALAVIGVVATVVGLSVFSASGQTGDEAELRGALKRPHPATNDSEKPAPQTYVKTYYVGDLIIPVKRGTIPVTVAKMPAEVKVDLTPVIDLITSTVAKGTWTIRDGRGHRMIIDGKQVELKDGVATPKTVGAITPFFLSISLIVRHTAEVHDEVADLLRKLRRLQESWQPPEQTHDPKSAPRPMARLPIAMSASGTSLTSSARRSRTCPRTRTDTRPSIPDPARARPGAPAGFSRRTRRITIGLG